MTPRLVMLLIVGAIGGCLGVAMAQQLGYGYIGPACAVFDGTLWLHGVSKRKLSQEEIHIFQLYQQDLSMFKDSPPTQFDTSPPLVPYFCGGLDDSIEVVLDACLVRNNHVYIGDTLVRPLTNAERHRIDVLKLTRDARRRSRRVRRATNLSELFHRVLRINSTVTSRFLPVVSQSPLFAMEAPWRSMLEAKFAKDSQPTNSIDITKIDKKVPYKPVKKPQTTTTITPITPKIREIVISSTTMSPTTKSREETVLDPVILQLIAKALKRNQLITESDLKMAMSNNKITPTTTTTMPPRPLPIRFVVPQMAHNHLFIAPSYTNLVSPSTRNVPANPLSHRLPNEICRAHLGAKHHFDGNWRFN